MEKIGVKIVESTLEFLNKIVGAPIEEISNLLVDQIKFIRYKNQITILQKAEKYIKKKEITTKAIPIKILAPLLEQSSLEEDEFFQDKWANLLVNMVDSEKNFQSNVFPYLLNQISKEEYVELEELLRIEINHKKVLDSQAILRESGKNRTGEYFRTNQKIKQIEQDGFELSLKNFELANLVRLGLIRRTPPLIYIDDFDVDLDNLISPKKKDGYNQINISDVKAEYMTSFFGYRITEMGSKFIELCSS